MTLSRLSKVSIVSFKAKSMMALDNLNLYPLDENKLLDKSLESVIKKNNLCTDETKIIITYGYDVRVLLSLNKISKKYDCKLVSFTFDSHKGAISNKNIIKRLLINSYFNIGIKYLNSIDAIILFNKHAYKEMKLIIPYMVSKVGINENHISNRIYNRNSKKMFKIVYAGTLVEYNSVDVLIDTMEYLNGHEVCLDIYGDGPLKKNIVAAAEQRNNINYHGLVSNKEINETIKSADLLINLRDTNSYVSKFAFPSKLIQYMASGVPVLTTKVISGMEFSHAAFVIDNLDPKGISESIIYIKNHPEIQTQKSEYAKKFIRTNFLWPVIIQDVMKFLSDISEDSWKEKP